MVIDSHKGSADCPHYAEVELLAQQLSTNLDHFTVHKIIKPQHQWNVSHCCVMCSRGLGLGLPQ